MLKKYIHWVKIVAGCIWLSVIIIGGVWIYRTGIPLHNLPSHIKYIIIAYGVWGPCLLIVAHILRTVLFLPITLLFLLAGSMYGPFWGVVISTIGENISASIAFAMAKFFGRRFVIEHEEGWVRKYDQLLINEGFFTILTMRLLGFPFDVVNFLSGMTGVTYRQFFFATLLGVLPSTITITVLGDAFGNPKAFALFGLLLAGTLAIVVLLRRSKWVKEKLYVKRPEHVI
jgi:uncharacterized membrane protein YdjX (TVP38/TMEM64 family)